ncbi:MAG: ABC transporter ATP-binding protein [Deltaproteobacteria bacterium]|nr:ABC transporter ATP-binding protein [Deltaproteobacteria bacterium]
MQSFIHFENICKSFGPKKIFEDLNLDVQKGETLCIIGGSGSGKSVLLKIFLRLLPLDTGKIIFDGEEVMSMNGAQLIKMRKRIAMLFQGAALFDSLSVKDNVAYPLREHSSYSEEEIDQIVNEKLEDVGLPGIGKMLPSDLSGGMRKRVGLARAIATNPELILYDEPTTGLDPTNSRRIDDLIVHLKEKYKATSIVVTHDMQSVAHVSDRIAFLYNYKVEYVGTLEELKKENHQVVKDFMAGTLKD